MNMFNNKFPTIECSLSEKEIFILINCEIILGDLAGKIAEYKKELEDENSEQAQSQSL